MAVDGIVLRIAKRTRDRLLRGLKGDLADTRAELAATRLRLDELAAEMAALRAGDIAMGVRANRTLASEGRLSNLTAADRCGDGTMNGALGYLDWESSVAAYRSTFQRAIDLLRSGQIAGPVVEFGTCSGFTARIICELLNTRNFDVDFHMYDSFVGLPDMTGTPDETSYDVKTNKVWHEGSMAVPDGYEKEIWKRLIQVRPAEKLHMVKGFYQDTLDSGLPRERCSLIHIDCDIYSSAKYVLDKLEEKDLFQDGCVVLFDDWNCNRANPNQGERRAFAEFLRERPRWTCTPWFVYGWNGQAFILHDSTVA